MTGSHPAISPAAGSGTGEPATAGWLALAAAPTFALMGLIAASDAAPAALCAPGSGIPLTGMTAMYLLMSLFHLPPWLKLARQRPCAPDR